MTVTELHNIRSRSFYTILEINDLDDPKILCSLSAYKNIQLHNYHDIPTFLKGNPYVLHGYRVLLPGYLCIKSLFLWSNETINIWSHLCGFILFFFLLIYDNIIGIPNLKGSTTDHIVVSIGLICYQICMLSSAGYHLFMCHSEKASKRWLALDLTGILTGLLGCYLPGVYYSFYCMSVWRDVYLVTIFVFFTGLFILQTRPRFLTPQYFKLRLVLYISICAYGIVPTIHWVWLHGGISNQIVKIFLPKLVVEYVLGILAFSFYISKCPERFNPGMFDYVGSSHQFWHILVVIAFLWWHQTGKDLLEYRIQNQCFY